jgi:hypothetical protein
MVQYEITQLYAVGQGEIVQLTAAQATLRAHQLESLGAARYRVVQVVQFKKGEVLGIEGEIPKVHLSRVRALLNQEPVIDLSEPRAAAVKKLKK